MYLTISLYQRERRVEVKNENEKYKNEKQRESKNDTKRYKGYQIQSILYALCPTSNITEHNLHMQPRPP